ncbi:MAG: DNA-binding protein [Proteobacteria bacterium]|nr:DNA-binding protein [Pseudomonadota bacterium]MBU1716879.1 DNA-binding protein [Pseudomonadota bacterium]
MKKFIILSLSVLLTMTVGCNDEKTKSVEQAPTEINQPGASLSGTVTETMDASGYTYVQIDTGSEKIWAAGPRTALKVGDEVSMPQGSPIQNFQSKTLNREFEMIYFVSLIIVAGADQTIGSADMPADHPSTISPEQIDFSGIEKAVDGHTIAEIYAGKADLNGKPVMFRGKAVKFTKQIMGKNWLHVQDGSGSQGTNDLTVTTDADVMVKVGDTVLISGTLTADKDFGSGYRYDIIIEDAKVSVE